MPASKYKKKRKLNKITMKEISIVGKPAQEPALIAITKSAWEEREEPDMSKELQEKLDRLQKQADDQQDLITKQTANIERLTKVNSMDTEVRAYFEKLDEAGQTEFLTKSAEVQRAEVQNAQLANAVIYKDRNGIEYRKQDDPRLVQMAKDADEQAKIVKQMQTDNADLKLQKMVDEFQYLPGDDKARQALVKSVMSIEDEAERNAAIEILKSKNKSNSSAFTTHGITGDGAAETMTKASTDLDEIVQKHMKDNNVTLEKAYDEVLQTTEGAKLYEQMEGRLQ